MPLNFIGLVGRKHVGKDTVADYLVEKYGYIKLSFATPLKEMLKILFGFTDEQVNGSLKEVIDEHWNVTPRRVMEYVGTTLFRENINNLLPNIQDNFWVEIMKYKCQKIIEKNPNIKIVFSDVRFQNEVDMITGELGGKIIKITRNNVIYSQVENGIDNIMADINIENNSNIEELLDRINSLFT